MTIPISFVDATVMDLWKNKYVIMIMMMITISNRKFNEKD